jgi:4-amino-4-deoxy-L-arabinose transferase
MAVLSKWLPAFIVFPIWLILVLDSGKFSLNEKIVSLLILITITLMVFLPWQIYIFRQFPLEARWEASFNIRHITEGLEGHGKSFWYHYLQLGQIYGQLVYLPMVWFIYKAILVRMNYKRLLLLVWFILPLLFFSFVKTKMKGYTIFTSGAVCIIIALYFTYLKSNIHNFKTKIIPVLILILLIVWPVFVCFEKTNMFQRCNREPEWVKNIKELQPLAKQLKGKLIIFNTDRPIESMFYLDCVAYSFIPTEDKIAELEREGYTILIK